MSRIARYDVIVVGAGVAGASVAYFLAGGGARVLVMEKSRLPRYKPCGGAVPRVVHAEFPFDATPVIDCAPARVTYSWQGIPGATYDLPGQPITMVMRDRFDQHILDHASADVWDRVSVRSVEQSSREVRMITDSGDAAAANHVIGADGALSSVARMAGLRGRRLLTPAIEAEVVPDSATYETYASTARFDFGVIPHGYLWIFPKRDHLSVGIACFRATCAGLQRAFIQEMSRLGIDLAGARLHGHTLPVCRRTERLAAGRVMLIGDAAGLVDPLSGEGIRHAVASARLAAQAILESRPSHYSVLVRRYVNGAIRPLGLVADIFYRRPQLCYRYGIRNPRATNLLGEWLSQRASRARVMTGLASCMLEEALRRR